MSELEDFLGSTVERHIAADTALHNGDAALRKAMWSVRDPVTLFGAAATNTGSDEIDATFDWLASSFSDCSQFAFEVVSAGVSGDLACTVGYEHSTLVIDGIPAQPYTLRVTHVYRREEGEWKIVHRHGDRVPADGSMQAFIKNGA
jgi:ketosteroid isomerase-like protein